MDIEAEFVWTAELLRRQEAHIVEVWRLLNAWPKELPVTLRYGPGREVAGTIVKLDADMVELKVREGWTRWVPLLQVDAIDGTEIETAAKLPRPKVDGVVEMVVKGER